MALTWGLTRFFQVLRRLPLMHHSLRMKPVNYILPLEITGNRVETVPVSQGNKMVHGHFFSVTYYVLPMSMWQCLPPRCQRVCNSCATKNLQGQEDMHFRELLMTTKALAGDSQSKARSRSEPLAAYVGEERGATQWIALRIEHVRQRPPQTMDSKEKTT